MIAMRTRALPVANLDTFRILTTSRLWKSGDLTISNGGPGPPTPEELVPYVITTVFVTKELEIRFSNDDTWRKVGSFIAGHHDVEIGGIPLAKHAYWTTQNMIIVSQPFLFAANVRRVPKSPNPAPNVDFKE